MKKFVAGLFILLLTGCSSSKPKLHLFIWSDFISPAVIESFEEVYDCSIVIDTFDTNEAMYAKINTGSPGYDLVFPTEYFVSLMVHEGLLQKIDPAKLSNFENLDNSKLNLLNYEPSSYALPYLLTFNGLAWNEKRVQLEDISWNVFANSKYRGRMTMLNDIREALGVALMTLGYSVNTIEQQEIDAARDLIIKWKPNLAKFESEQYKIGLATNEYFITQAYNTDIGQLAEEVDGISFQIPKEGGIVSFDMIAIPADARNTELAYAFINYLLNPKVAALNIEQTKGYAPVKGVTDYVDTVYIDNEIIFLPTEALERCQVIRDLGKDILLYNRAWDQIKLSD